MAQTCARNFGTSELRLDKDRLSKIKKYQAHFQVMNDLPVHLKGGSLDVVLYYTSTALVILGVGMSFRAMYQLANKK